jgi:predicted O-methyltransferase YrrM
MYSPVELAFKYLRYWLKASNGKGHGIHSPFLYEFVQEVLNDKRKFYSYQQIESIRHDLLSDERQLTIEDFGAGSHTGLTKKRLLKEIAKSSLKPKKFSQLLFRMVDHYQPKTILELGTSLGITTAYLASAKPDAQVITMEGSNAIANTAKENFKSLELKNIKVVEGNFDETLSPTISNMPSIDLAFLDGNHRYQPTINYFNEVLKKSHEHTIIILDDVHWSTEMEKAWEEIKQHPQVTMTIDLFFIGIVLLRKEFKVKQDFVVRF